MRNAVDEVENKKIAKIFGYFVNDPERYGVVNFDQNENIVSIEEKPRNPKSNYAISGLYFYPNDVIKIAKKQKPSPRGELEITDTNISFLETGSWKLKMGRGYAWLDTGTHDSMLNASLFVQTIEKRQGMKISCIRKSLSEWGLLIKINLSLLEMK